MRLIAPFQNKRLHQLINQHGIQAHEKAELVKEFSATSATSSKELSYFEAGRLISRLEGNEAEADTLQKMRGKLLSMAHEVRWHLPGGALDMARVNAWCVKYGAEKKELNGYKLKELAKLVSQFRIFRDNFLTSLTSEPTV